MRAILWVIKPSGLTVLWAGLNLIAKAILVSTLSWRSDGFTCQGYLMGMGH